MEPSSECGNDYLELRDGQFGFSPLIERLCTNTLQLKSISSSGRWLWLRFHSDYSIQKNGFQVVFKYERMNANGEWHSRSISNVLFYWY